jgi:hypothetical protein
VRPEGKLWDRIRIKGGFPPAPTMIKYQLLGWLSGVVAIYSLLFGSGSFIFGDMANALLYGVFLILGITGVIYTLNKMTATKKVTNEF